VALLGDLTAAVLLAVAAAVVCGGTGGYRCGDGLLVACMCYVLVDLQQQ
jgi:hypothetical protein